MGSSFIFISELNTQRDLNKYCNFLYLLFAIYSIMSNQMEFGYWGIQGLGQPMRYMFAASGTAYKATDYTDMPAWFGEHKPNLFKETPFANLPYLKDEGRVIVQSGAVVRYLGDKLGYLGDNNVDSRINCDIIDGVLRDFWAKLVKLMFAKDTYEANKEKAHEEMLGLLTQINTFLESTKFVGGSKIVWADFFLYYVLTIFTRWSSKMAALSNFSKYMSDFEKAAGEPLVNFVNEIKDKQPMFPPGLVAIEGTLESMKKEF